MAQATASHVAVIGAGFVGASLAFTLVSRGSAAKVTLTDVNEDKCQGEVWDLEDAGANAEVATLKEAGQADIIVITAGRGLRPGEQRLDLVKANCGILKSVIEGMLPLKPTAKIIVVSNPCDALTFAAQEYSGLPPGQVIGSGTWLDTRRLRLGLAEKLKMHHSCISLWVLGEHGDSQFPVASLGKIAGVPLMAYPKMQKIDLAAEAAASMKKAYNIRAGKGQMGAPSYGVSSATTDIVEAILNDLKLVMPVSVRVPGRRCVLSLPTVIGINGAERIIDVIPHFNAEEHAKFEVSCKQVEASIATFA